MLAPEVAACGSKLNEAVTSTLSVMEVGVTAAKRANPVYEVLVMSKNVVRKILFGETALGRTRAAS